MKTQHFILHICLIFLFSCNKEIEEKREYPRINTLCVTDITENGAIFYAEVLTLGNTPIIEQGFLWGANENLDLNNAECKSIQVTNTTGEFHAYINSSLYKTQHYYVRAYIKTDDFTVLGNTLDFISNGSTPPVINSFSPIKGNWGDTIILKGGNFSRIANKVKFGNCDATSVSHSDSIIKVIVPSHFNGLKTNIFIETPDNTGSSKSEFEYLQPEVSDFSPSQATFGDTILIKGKKFNKNPQFITVHLGSSILHPISSSDSLIKIIVPNNLTQSINQLIVTSDSIKTTANKNFQLNHFSWNIAKTDTIKDLTNDIQITINGYGFSPELNGNKVLVNNMIAKIVEATKEKIVFVLPKELYNTDRNYSFQYQYRVEVQMADQSASTDNLFVLVNKGKWTWIKHPQFPGAARSFAVSFTLNGKGYVGTGCNTNSYFSDFYSFDPKTNSWTRIADLPGKPRAGAISLIINGEAYVGFGTDKIYFSSHELSSSNIFNDWYKYDEANNAWIALNSFPGAARSLPYSFLANNNAFLGGGYIINEEQTSTYWSNEFWQYISQSDTWQQLANIDINYSAVGYQSSTSGFVYDGTNLFQYNNGIWNKKVIQYVGYDFTANSINDTGYIILPMFHQVIGTNNIYAINLNSYSTNHIIFPGVTRSMPSSFVIGNSLFVTLGRTYSSSQQEIVYLNDMYELQISE